MGESCLQDTDTKAFVVFWVVCLEFFWICLFGFFVLPSKVSMLQFQPEWRDVPFLTYSFTDSLQARTFFWSLVLNIPWAFPICSQLIFVSFSNN